MTRKPRRKSPEMVATIHNLVSSTPILRLKFKGQPFCEITFPNDLDAENKAQMFLGLLQKYDLDNDYTGEFVSRELLETERWSR